MTPNRLIKMLCKYLRHRPHELGLKPSAIKAQGVYVNDLVAALCSKSVFIDILKLFEIVRGDPHKRLLCDSDYYIRPSYGPNSSSMSMGFFGKCTAHDEALWLPTRFARLPSINGIPLKTGRDFGVYADFSDASAKAARYKKTDVPVVVKICLPHPVLLLVKSGRTFLHSIHPNYVKEVRKLAPALGLTWEQSKEANVWSYSIISADLRKM